MTRKRNDNHSTEFGLWLRNERPIRKYCQHCGNSWVEGGERLREDDPISSKNGFQATNIDYLWRNKDIGKWMLIEEKRYGYNPKGWQKYVFNLLNWCAKHHPRFCGFHYIIFEKTSPLDGKIYLDNREISEEYLLRFLAFEEGE